MMASTLPPLVCHLNICLVDSTQFPQNFKPYKGRRVDVLASFLDQKDSLKHKEFWNWKIISEQSMPDLWFLFKCLIILPEKIYLYYQHNKYLSNICANNEKIIFLRSMYILFWKQMSH